MAITGAPLFTPAVTSVPMGIGMSRLFINVPTGQDGVWASCGNGDNLDSLDIRNGGGTDGYSLKVGGASSFGPVNVSLSNVSVFSAVEDSVVIDRVSGSAFSNLLVNYSFHHGLRLQNGSDRNVFTGVAIVDSGQASADTYDCVSIDTDGGDYNVFDGFVIDSSQHRHSFNLAGGVGNVVGVRTGLGDADTSEFNETVTWDNDFGEVVQETYAASGVVATSTGGLEVPILADGVLVDVLTRLGTAGTGSETTVDVNLNGSTIFPTAGDRPSMATSSKTDTAEPTNVTEVVKDGFLTVDVDVADSNAVAADLTVSVRYVKY